MRFAFCVSNANAKIADAKIYEDKRDCTVLYTYIFFRFILYLCFMCIPTLLH